MKNNIKIALRSFKNNKFYSSINLSGLVVGMAACFLLLMYLQYEMGYDQFHEEGEKIYQVNLSVNFGGEAFNTSNNSISDSSRAIKFALVQSISSCSIKSKSFIQRLDFTCFYWHYASNRGTSR